MREHASCFLDRVTYYLKGIKINNKQVTKDDVYDKTGEKVVYLDFYFGWQV